MWGCESTDLTSCSIAGSSGLGSFIPGNILGPGKETSDETLVFDPVNVTGKLEVASQFGGSSVSGTATSGWDPIIAFGVQKKNVPAEYKPFIEELLVSDAVPSKSKDPSQSGRSAIGGSAIGCFELITSLAVKENKAPAEYKPFIKKLEPTGSCKKFYKIQSQHRIGGESERVHVSIWIAQSGPYPDTTPSGKRRQFKAVHKDWIEHLENAITDINDAAPGLYLYRCYKRSDAKIHIYGTEENVGAATWGNIGIENFTVFICLPDSWNAKKRTSCHELLHGIFAKHEHQRSDGKEHLFYHSNSSHLKPSCDILGLTRFDPFSIMLYCESDDTFTRNTTKDEVWKLKKEGENNIEMSQLDKVGLNILFRPCIGPDYSPKQQPGGLWYCGRNGSTPKHNRPPSSMTDGRCGPDNGPNCPACRVLKTDMIEKLAKEDKWQGWSGMVYCWKYFGRQEEGHDGYCGPNNGPACPQCRVYIKM